MTIVQLGCSDDADPTLPIVSQPDTLLSTTRLQTLPAGQRSDWLAYLARSSEWRGRDAQQIQNELAQIGQTTWQPAQAGADFRVLPEMSGNWYTTAAAHRLADVIVSFQTPSGGWSKAVDYTNAREPGQSFASGTTWQWIATFDNGATTEQLRLLGATGQAQSETNHRAAFLRGLAYIGSAQFPNGCWPQVYPLEGEYHDAVTYNDQVTVRILQVLSGVASGSYGFVAQAERNSAAAMIDNALGCIVASQVVVKGQRTVWAQQHDPITLAPIKGRAYEPAALVSFESAAILDVILQVRSPAPALVSAAHAAAGWLKARRIYGYNYDARGELIESAGAGPLWSRFYEIGSNRPIFGDRDGSIHYDLREVSQERRSGYMWYTAAPAATLARYESWKVEHPAAAVNQ